MSRVRNSIAVGVMCFFAQMLFADEAPPTPDAAPLVARVFAVWTSSEAKDRGEQLVACMFVINAKSLKVAEAPAPFDISELELPEEFLTTHPELRFENDYDLSADYTDKTDIIECSLIFNAPGNFTKLPALAATMIVSYPDQFSEAVWENPAAESDKPARSARGKSRWIKSKPPAPNGARPPSN